MTRTQCLLAVAGLVLAVIACSETQEGSGAAQDSEQWSNIIAAKTELEAKRAELMALHAADEAEDAAEEDAEDTEDTPADESEEGEEGAASTEEVVDLDEFQKEIDELAGAFGQQLVDFINSQGISVGGELTPQQREALDMKAGEDLLVAQEYIDKGGDYSRAINIYIQALVVDPNSTILLAAKEKAEAERYMTEERFSAVTKGMSTDEVRSLLGTPRPENVREFDNGIIGWYYPKDEPRSAAGIFYQEKKDVLGVYKTDFNAIEAAEPEVR